MKHTHNTLRKFAKGTLLSLALILIFATVFTCVLTSSSDGVFNVENNMQNNVAKGISYDDTNNKITISRSEFFAGDNYTLPYQAMYSKYWTYSHDKGEKDTRIYDNGTGTNYVGWTNCNIDGDEGAGYAEATMTVELTGFKFYRFAVQWAGSVSFTSGNDGDGDQQGFIGLSVTTTNNSTRTWVGDTGTCTKWGGTANDVSINHSWSSSYDKTYSTIVDTSTGTTTIVFYFRTRFDNDRWWVNADMTNYSATLEGIRIIPLDWSRTDEITDIGTDTAAKTTTIYDTVPVGDASHQPLWRESSGTSTMSINFSNNIKTIINTGFVKCLVTVKGACHWATGPDTLNVTVTPNGQQLAIYENDWSSSLAESSITTGIFYLPTGTTKLDFSVWDTDSDTNTDVGATEITVSLQIDFTGKGTSGDPFILANREDFDELSLGVRNGATGEGITFKVVPENGEKYIDFEYDNKFIPIGGVDPVDDDAYSTNNTFKGTLDGNSSQILNLATDRAANYNGLFGGVDGATIKNLTIVNPSIAGGGTSRGAFVGRNWNSVTLENCNVVVDNYNYSMEAGQGEISGTYQVGGIIGYADGTVSINNCHVMKDDGGGDGILNISATSYGSSQNWSAAGGIVGSAGASSDITITNCTSNASVKGKLTIIENEAPKGKGVGGIIGYIDNTGTITNCSNTGTISGVPAIGGIVGYANSVTIESCYNTGDVSSEGYFNYQSADGACVGGIAGYTNGSISNCYNLGRIGALNQYQYDDVVGGIVGYSSSNISYCYNNADVYGCDFTGGIAGNCAGDISYCYVDGAIHQLWENSNNDVDMGYINGGSANSYTGCWIIDEVVLSPAPGAAPYDFTVKNDASYVSYVNNVNTDTSTHAITPIYNGNVVEWTSIITNDIATFRVSADVLANNYLTTKVNGSGASTPAVNVDTTVHDDNSLSLVLDFASNCITSGSYLALGQSVIEVETEELNEAYNGQDHSSKILFTSPTITSPYVAGFSKINENNSITKDDNGNIIFTDIKAAGNYNVSPIVLMEVGDENIIIGIGSGVSIAIKIDIDLEGDGASEKTAFKLTNRADFETLAALVNGNADTNGIYFKVEPENGSTIDFGSATFDPIGNGENVSFKGILLGNNATITLTISRASSDYTGLFGHIEGATIKDLSIAGSVSGQYYVGALVGYAGANSIIENIDNSATVSAKVALGGIAGYFGGLYLTGCSNTGSVTVSASGYTQTIVEQGTHAGGIVGHASGDISNCYNSGAVGWTGTNFSYHNYTGGIVGYSTGNIYHCYNGGNTSGGDYVGGIVGKHTGTALEYCYVNCTVNSTRNDTGANYGYISGGSSSVHQTSWRLLNAAFTGPNVSGSSSNRKSNALHLYTQYANNVSGQELKPVKQDYEETEWLMITEHDIEAFKLQATIVYGGYMYSQYFNGYNSSSKPTAVADVKPIHLYESEDTGSSIVVKAVYSAACVPAGGIGLWVDKSTITPNSSSSNTFDFNGEDLSDKVAFSYPTINPSSADFENRAYFATFYDASGDVSLINAKVDPPYTVYPVINMKDKDGNLQPVGKSNGSAISITIHVNKATINLEDVKFGISIDKPHIIAGTAETVTVLVDGKEEERQYYMLDAQSLTINPTMVYGNSPDYTNDASFVMFWKNENGNWIVLRNEDFDVTQQELGGNSSIIGATITTSTSSGGNFTEGTSLTKYCMLFDSDFGVIDGNSRTDGTWGSSENPFVISNKYQLTRLSQIVNGGTAWDSIQGDTNDDNRRYQDKYFLLTDNINIIADDHFSPIGGTIVYDENGTAILRPFSGNFNSDSTNNTITYDITADRNYAGLFGAVNGANINGFKIRIAHIYADNYDYVGGLVGRAEDSIVENVIVDITENEAVNGGDYVGGIVGYAVGNSNTTMKIVNCAVNVGNVSGYNYVGGIVGYADKTSIIANYTQNGTSVANLEFMNATTVSGYNYVGGVAGYWYININGQFNDGTRAIYNGTSVTTYNGAVLAYDTQATVSGDVYVGGIAGYFVSDAVEFAIQAYAKTTAVNGRSFVGGLYGVFVGNSYDADANHIKRSTIYVDDTLEIASVVTSATATNHGNVMGALFGHVSKVGIVLANDISSSICTTYTTTSSDDNSYVNFVGFIAGIIGENATIEGQWQEEVSGGNYSSITTDTALVGNNYVGGIAGYVASNAGTYYNNNWTIFGNKVWLINGASVTGNHHVGGLFGSVGKVDNDFALALNEDVDGIFESAEFAGEYLRSIIQNNSNNDVTLGNIDDSSNGYGRLINNANIAGETNVGGIVGSVTNNAQIKFENPATSSASAIYSDLAVYNGNGDEENPVNIIISGNSNIGGIAGYLGEKNHSLHHVVSEAVVLGADVEIDDDNVKLATNIGGLVGEMHYGNITNSLAYAYQTTKSSSDNALEYNGYRGSVSVGGIVGYLAGGSIMDSLSSGMKFDAVKDNAAIGGVVGEVGVAASISNAYALIVVPQSGNGATSGSEGEEGYTLTTANTNGGVILIDERLSSTTLPTVFEMAITLGICTQQDLKSTTLTHAAYINNNTTATDHVLSKVGYLSLAVKIPGGSDFPNSQLAFYDASGNDAGSNNQFETFSEKGSYIYIRMGVVGTEAQGNIAFYIKNVEFDIISAYNPNDTDNEITGKQNVEKEYIAPGHSDLYSFVATTVVYDTDTTGGVTPTYNVTQIIGSVKYLYNDELVDIGAYSATFEPGQSEASPFIISNQTAWDNFVKAVIAGTNQHKFVALDTSDIVVQYSADFKNGNNLINGGYNTCGSLFKNSEDQFNGFTGTFNGNGHTITVKMSYNHTGLSVFPYAKNATFKNVTITGYVSALAQGTVDTNTKDADGNNTYTITPSDIRYNYNTTDEEYEYALHASSNIAGFVGEPMGGVTFENCNNDANVAGFENSGGFVGSNGTTSRYLKFTNCVNTGDIISTDGSYARGGYSSTYCYDDGWGNDTGYPHGTGGFVGKQHGLLVLESCRNAGNVTGGHNIGGLVGRHDGYGNDDLLDDNNIVISDIFVFNCANTGEILSNSGYWGSGDGPIDGGSSRGLRENIWGFAGGLVGKTANYSILQMVSSYNSGTVTTYSNVAGGLVGSVGLMRQEANLLALPPNIWGDHCYTRGKSTIAYCYNTGTINAGGTTEKKTTAWDRGRENYGGTITGGIVAYAGWIEIDQCYNTGELNNYGIIGYQMSYQVRSAGILGQAVPRKAKNSDGDGKVTITNCYNVGNIIARSGGAAFLGWNAAKTLRYSAPIIGYNDHSDKATDTYMSATNCYSIKNAVLVIENNAIIKMSTWLYNDDMIDAQEILVRTGTTFDTYSELTALMNSDGTIAPTSTTVKLPESIESIGRTSAALYASDRPNGWLYVYGCLPQLAVFAVDTPNGLSMNAVGAGTEYPFIIKDGVDLLGLSALVGRGYDFNGKNIAFANADNNLEKIVSSTINMPTQLNDDGNLEGTNAYTASNGVKGKSYHLFENGAMCNEARKTLITKTVDKETVVERLDYNTVDEEYGYWEDNNYSYYESGSIVGLKADTPITTVNMYPIGKASSNSRPFRGNITGEQADNTNTLIKDVNIHVGYKNKPDAFAYAGLFGMTENATVSHITTSGEITAYTARTNDNAYAGGIVGYAYGAGGTTIIEHCSTTATIKAAGRGELNSVVGGIVGLAEVVSSPINIDGCFIDGDPSLTSQITYLGGIIGYAKGSNKLNIKNCTVDNVTLNTLNPYTGYEIGGIIGSAQDSTQLTIDHCKVGSVSDVAINGRYNIGGIMGRANGNAVISNSEVGTYTTITALYDSADTNPYDYTQGIGVGGFVGYTNATSGFALGFSGTIRSNATIILEHPESKVVGGIIGRMQGVRFIHNVSDVAHPYPEVVSAATIKFKDGVVGEGRDIGGVAGYTAGAEFTGVFIISPTLNLGNSQNVGGFIGTNGGESAILAHQASTTQQNPSAGESDTSLTYIFVGGNITAQKNVGGFVGQNGADAQLTIAPDTYNSVNYGANNVQIMIIGNDQTVNLGTEEKPDNISIKGTRIVVTGIEESEDVGSKRIANAGGFIGFNDGTLTIVKGEITINEGAKISSAQKQSDDTYLVSGVNVGGIIGYNLGTLTTGGSNNSATLQITNKGEVSGYGDVGGIIGLLAEGNINGSFTNEGNVIGGYLGSDYTYVGGDNIGGIIGNFDAGKMSGTYVNMGNVEGNNFVGGVIGFMSNRATIDGDNTTFTNTTKSSATTAQEERRLPVIGVDSGASVAQDDASTIQDGDATDNTGSDTTDTASVGGHVEGYGYGIGGSIGGMFGTIDGGDATDLSQAVVFTNIGTIDGYDYIGGSIGILGGTMSQAVFVNDSTSMSVTNNYTDVTITVGGSVGYIGNPTNVALYNNDGNAITYSGANISNSHFEFNGNLQVRGKAEESGEDGGKNGIGGAIGVIDDCATWSNNTFYIDGNVDATNGGDANYANLSNVGGVVGYIGAEDIKLSNLLIYHAHVQGGINVGGFVGASFASGTVIEHSYNIEGNVSGDGTTRFSITVEEGESSSVKSFMTVGGIIGKPYVATESGKKSTDASTSYWVKGKPNSSLEYLTIDTLNVATTDTLYYDLEWTKGSGDNAILNKQTLQTTTLLPYYLLEADGETTTESGEAHEDTGTTVTDSDGVARTPHKTTITDSLKTTLIVNGNGKSVKLYSITTTTTIFVGTKVVANGETTYEYTSSSSSTANPNATYEIALIENGVIGSYNPPNTLTDTTTWQTVLGIGTYTTVGDFIVGQVGTTQSNTGMTYTGGTTGWFFVYANDEALDGDIVELHAGDTNVETNNENLNYWKKIVNAKTFDKNQDKLVGSSVEDTDVSNIIKPVNRVDDSGNTIVDDNGDAINYYEVRQNTIYAKADIGQTEGNVGYYLYAASSILPQSMTDWFNLQGQNIANVVDHYQGVKDSDDSNAYYYFSAPTDGSLGNIALYYRRIDIAPSIVYNSVNRVLPLKNVELQDADEYFTANISEAVDANGKPLMFKHAGSYTGNTIDVDLKFTHHYDGGKKVLTYDLNEEFTPTWNIAHKEVKVSTISNGAVYGGNSMVNVLVQGIAPFDDMSTQDNNFILQVDVKQNGSSTNTYYVAHFIKGGTGALYYVSTDKNTWTPVTNDSEYDTNNGYLFVASTLTASNTLLDATFVHANDQTNISNNNKAKGFSFMIDLDDVSEYEVSFSSAQITNDHEVKANKAKVKVSPAPLYIKRSSSVQDKIYDTTGHTSSWDITGWQYSETLNTLYNGTAYSSLFTSGAKANAKNIASNANSVTLSATAPSTLTLNNMINADEYSIKFNNTVYGNYVFSTSGGTTNGNLTAQKTTQPFTINKLQVSLINTTGAGSHTYNKSSVGTLTTGFKIDSSNISMSSAIVNEVNKLVTFTKTPSSGSSWSATASGFDTSGKAVFKTDVNVGSYTLKTSLSGNNNIAVNGSTKSATYKINRKEITASISVNASSFVYNTQNQGVITVKLDGLESGDSESPLVNVSADNGWTGVSSVSPNGYTTSDTGKYTAQVVSGDIGKNYKIGNSPTVSWDITPASLSAIGDTNVTKRYDGIALIPSFTISVDGNAVANNTFGADEIAWAYAITDDDTNDSVNEMVDVGKYTVTFGDITITRNNASTGANGVALINNYAISKDGAERKYSITPTPVTPKVNTVTIDGISGGKPSKVYDATNEYTIPGNNNISVKFNESIYPSSSGYTISRDIVYDGVDVGTRTVTYTITLTDKNFEFEGGGMVATTTNTGYITPATLTVTIDTLRNNTATKEYDATTAFGGAGFNGNSDGNSAIHRTGNGFKVEGFPTGGSAVSITARYAEVDSNRSAFDSFVNNVSGDGTSATIGSTQYYKKLIFTMTSSGVCNYVFEVKAGSGTSSVSTQDNQEIEVYDKDDGNTSTFGAIDIEITPLTIKVTYQNQSQSYANPDNTYNTDWDPITATVKEDVAKTDRITINVVNGWLKPGMTITQYKYIRGRVGSSELSASIAKNANGSHVNYILKNQPFLTIGYFVGTDAFEIGSLASLMIATYYQYMAVNANEEGFNIPTVSDVSWVTIATDEQYNGAFSAPSGYPTANEGVDSWDAYFEQLATEDEPIEVMYSPLNGGWGYYKVSETQTKQTYTKFKQVANVSGIMTASDLEMLNSFFTKVTYDANGNETVTMQDWGVGYTYLTNFFKTSTGNVITVYNAIFASDMGNCSYDGNGYTIDHINIVGNASADLNVGMFASANADNVKNVHLRNFNITVNGANSANTINAGGIIGSATSGTLHNSSFYGNINVSGNAKANVGAFIGSGNASVDGVIALGSIDVNAKSGAVVVGGIVGKGNTVSNAVSMMNLLVTKASGVSASVNAIVGSGSVGTAVVDGNSVSTATYLASSAWVKEGSVYTAAGNNSANEKSYAQLYSGSYSGYISTNYFAEDARTNTLTYDVIDNFKPLDIESSASARESMRLRDMIDTYLLMYAIKEQSGTVLGKTAGYYTISDTSWLVGSKHGTNTGDDAIVIANQQGVALVRELRFANFKLTNDVDMYSTYQHTPYVGAFYGNIALNSYKITMKDASNNVVIISTSLFEKMAGSVA